MPIAGNPKTIEKTTITSLTEPSTSIDLRKVQVSTVDMPASRTEFQRV